MIRRRREGTERERTMNRPTFVLNENAPGSDLAGETAAALATCSLIFRGSDPDYAEQCLQHAKELFSFAENYKAKYSDSSPQVANFYNSWSGYNDELVWGSTWEGVKFSLSEKLFKIRTN